MKKREVARKKKKKKKTLDCFPITLKKHPTNQRINLVILRMQKAFIKKEAQFYNLIREVERETFLATENLNLQFVILRSLKVEKKNFTINCKLHL